jgi:hypothetical protein
VRLCLGDRHFGSRFDFVQSEWCPMLDRGESSWVHIKLQSPSTRVTNKPLSLSTRRQCLYLPSGFSVWSSLVVLFDHDHVAIIDILSNSQLELGHCAISLRWGTTPNPAPVCHSSDPLRFGLGFELVGHVVASSSYMDHTCPPYLAWLCKRDFASLTRLLEHAGLQISRILSLAGSK